MKTGYLLLEKGAGNIRFSFRSEFSVSSQKVRGTVPCSLISGDNPHTVAALVKQTGMVELKLMTGPEVVVSAVQPGWRLV